ncbi:Limulus clotting factor C [Araneus ventricosus]|uniref:Limulus clotting factor C n=1 Tax=Araneus ventricosus TaxID=182803 RepID=A0A4Y2BRJ7_ARAVE|nr:Limulus clotting factor C [Araneus ventricosus]
MPQTSCFVPHMDVTGMIIEPVFDVKDRTKTFLPGSSIHFDCEEGYELEGDEWIIYCKLTGEWSSNPPTCKVLSTFEEIPPAETRMGCPYPTVDPDGAIEDIPPNDPRRSGEGFEAGSPVSFTCNDGYEIQGSSTIICLRNGQWNNPPPICRINLLAVNPVASDLEQCTDPGPIANGGVIVYYSIARARRSPSVSAIKYPVGTRLEYDCIEEYRLQGERQLNCRSTGQWSGKKPTCVAECGLSLVQPSPPILPGTKTIPGEWPWTVAIAVNERNITKFQCSGVLLDSMTILTVAHCVEKDKRYTLFFGIFNFTNGTKESFVEERKNHQHRVLRHPDFSDIALVTFYPPVRLTERIQPICLPTPISTARNLVPGEKGFVSGWELTTNDSQPGEMKMIQIPVISEQTCMEALRKKRVPLAITPDMFGAGLQEGITDFCSVTPGSPMVFYNAEAGRYTLEGLVIWRSNAPCEKRESYILMARVSSFTQWIFEKSQTQKLYLEEFFKLRK